MNFHIFHIFSLPNLSKILYSCDSILMSMTHLLIYTFIHLNLIVLSNKLINMPTPLTVSEPLTEKAPV